MCPAVLSDNFLSLQSQSDIQSFAPHPPQELSKDQSFNLSYSVEGIQPGAAGSPTLSSHIPPVGTFDYGPQAFLHPLSYEPDQFSHQTRFSQGHEATSDIAFDDFVQLPNIQDPISACDLDEPSVVCPVVLDNLVYPASSVSVNPSSTSASIAAVDSRMVTLKLENSDDMEAQNSTGNVTLLNQRRRTSGRCKTESDHALRKGLKAALIKKRIQKTRSVTAASTNQHDPTQLANASQFSYPITSTYLPTSMPMFQLMPSVPSLPLPLHAHQYNQPQHQSALTISAHSFNMNPTAAHDVSRRSSHQPSPAMQHDVRLPEHSHNYSHQTPLTNEGSYPTPNYYGQTDLGTAIASSILLTSAPMQPMPQASHQEQLPHTLLKAPSYHDVIRQRNADELETMSDDESITTRCHSQSAPQNFTDERQPELHDTKAHLKCSGSPDSIMMTEDWRPRQTTAPPYFGGGASYADNAICSQRSKFSVSALTMPFQAATQARKTSRSADTHNKHICPDCSKSFTRPFNLRSHVRTHQVADNEKKPFTCGKCDWRFTRKHDLNRHIRARHPHASGRSSK
ncbi:hypothetical protein BGZ99_002123 [Dissophora globulifera]|uniref:C2H2-type domain-containing protein n=1 Tax=Dissophora globulifera TaxID=979702 RepID=A0A9P6RXT0_9FUNG|nr:hypothetical protein BGZ99_002123 [Dissophora globulifera]